MELKMKYCLGILAALFVTMFALPQAEAIIELRATYGMLASKPDLSKLYNGTSELPTIVPNYGGGADLLLFLPFGSTGLGVRYEDLGLKASQDGLEFKSKATRTAVLLSYRLINTILHIGPIFSYGISHSGNMTVEQGATKYDWKPESVTSYSAGLEAGLGLGPFVLGAETGYQSMQWKTTTDKSGTSTNTPDINMSGTYVKAYFGFGI